MATEAINEAFLPKRTPVTSPVCSVEEKERERDNAVKVMHNVIAPL
jgi:hypothetical protein